MKRAYWCVLLLYVCGVTAADVAITGTVINSNDGGPLEGVVVSLAAESGFSTVSDSEGKFTLMSSVSADPRRRSQTTPVRFGVRGRSLIMYSASDKVSGHVSIFNTNGKQLFSADFTDFDPRSDQLTLPSSASGLNILRIAVGNKTYTCPVIQMDNGMNMKQSGPTETDNVRLAKLMADPVDDTLIAVKDGYVEKRTPVTSYTLSDITVSMDEVISKDNCNATTLKEAGACGNHEMLIGTAISPQNLSGLASQEFNYVTPENEMKWQYLQGSEGSFNFSQADAIVNWAQQNGIKVKGHCLVWHSQLAGWVEQARGRDRVLGIMKNHIETVMGHFGNKVYAWDVVNEAIATDNDNGSGNARMRNTVFYNEIGPDYIKLAFEIAREYADNHNMEDMILYYNDYSIDADNDKSRFTRTVVKEWVDNGVPIDGVGFQMHIGPPNNIPTVEAVRDNMQYYSDLGLEVLISEWDINLCGNQVSAQQQLQLYHDITQVCVNQPKCSAITFWGVNDGDSWLNSWSTALCNGASSQSLLFNNNQKKQTYYQVLDALNGK